MSLKKIIALIAWIILSICILNSLYWIVITIINAGDLVYMLWQQAQSIYKPLIIWSLLILVSNSYHSEKDHS